ncbi:MAG: 50S ribosomal protein L35 [Clostridia bacterium]|nr:50S ribosomal protein L35 [Clostridia bacterium]
MPKQRNSSATKKRFIVLKSGKVKRGRQNKRHLLAGKETARKRNLRRDAYVEGKQIKTVKHLVGQQG